MARSMSLARGWLAFVAAWCGLVTGMTATAPPDLSTTLGEDHQPRLPYFLGGPPSDLRDRASGPGSSLAPHRAHGPGLHSASTGTPASFTIRLRGGGCGGEGEGHTHANQNASAEDSLPRAMDDKHFVYVWIASADHVFHAAVVNNGDGTLTVTYESPYPGDYLVHIEDVCTDMNVVGRGNKHPRERAKAIKNSPFKLTISGEVAVDVDGLPLCDAEEEDEEDTFWRMGSWISSNLASAQHGVLRDGWVFQPKNCVHDTFSYDDLMLLAKDVKEPTWLLILGTSVQRGVFLTLVDMVLAQGQKSDFATSSIQKCWGFAEIRVGNLRLTYQDLRLHEVGLAQDDSAVCHDDKLAINNVAVFVAAARRFLRRSVFAADKQWPSVIMAPPFMEDSDQAANLPITVLMDALPSAWNGTLLMMEHMAGLGFTYNYDNPTSATLAEVNPTWHLSKFVGVDNGLGRIKSYQQQDPRTTFMSTFPIYQSRLFENEFSSPGRACYGCSVHYHYVTKPTAPESFNGSRMIHSAVTEMLANIVISKAVGSKAALYERAAPSTDTNNNRRGRGNETFEVCTDCPANLIPHHVKPVPVPVCNATSALAGDAAVGAAWGGRVCPQWCSKEPVDGVLNLKDVRVCSRARN
ncbi:unnamed protein product [Ectocarpus fasciculatus]